ncbi:MAG TPA: zf-HC2 domain-containing protein [Actinomycetota bacterium]
MIWHADAEMLRAYARGELAWASAASLEAHVERCDRCTLAAGALVDRTTLDRAWARIDDELISKPGIVERGLRRLAVPDHLARLLSATPSLSVSWLLAVAIAFGFAVTAANAGGRGGLLVYITIAPLLPLAGVAVAYGPGVDPTYEIGLSAPLRSFRLLLLRSAAVLIATLAIAAVSSVFLPAGAGLVIWLIPSIAVTSTGLALGSRRPLVAAGAVAVAWILAAFVAEARSQDVLRIARLDAQVALAAVALVAVSALWRRWRAVEGD